MPVKPCLGNGVSHPCPHHALTSHRTGRCDGCRDTPTRGYDHHHEQRREQLRPAVDAGKVRCPRCGQTIQPGQQWDLGHDDDDRSLPTEPQHAYCNRATRSFG